MKKFMLLLLLARTLPAEPPVPLSYAQVAPVVLERSLDLKAGQETVAVARSEVRVAEGERLPRLGIHSSYEFVTDNVVRGSLVSLTTELANTQPLTNHVLRSGIGLTIPVYSGGRLESAIHQKRYELESEEQNLQRERQRQVFLGKRAFLNYLVARENEEVSRLALLEGRETLRQAEARREAGKGTRFEVLQAQLAVSTRQQQVVETHSEVESRQAELAALVHLPVQTEFDIGESLQPGLAAQEPLPSRDLKSLTVIALDRRPELASLRAKLLALQEAQNGAAGAMRPEFNLSVNYNVLGASTMLYGGVTLMGELSIPLYDGGVTEARVDALEHRKLQLAAEQQKELDEIALQVKQALLAVEDVETRLKTAQDAVEQGREASRLASVRFTAGVGTGLELVTAQADYANARFVLANALYRQMIALAQLNYAIGVTPQ